jgi:hypothetical protein
MAIVRSFRKIAKNDCQLRYDCLSVRPHVATLLPIDVFL